MPSGLMPFDHIVVHIAGAQDVSVLKSNLDAANVPFEPDWGKSAKGFKVSNVWIGRDYFEFVEITNDDSVWRHEWVQRHLAGEHGAYCVFFRVDRDLEAIAQSLAQANIAHGVIEQTRFKWLFGLLEKRLPWRYLILPPLPGSRIEIGLIQYEPGAAEKNKPYMVPNGEDVGACRAKQGTDCHHRLGWCQTQTVPAGASAWDKYGSAPDRSIRLFRPVEVRNAAT